MLLSLRLSITTKSQKVKNRKCFIDWHRMTLRPKSFFKNFIYAIKTPDKKLICMIYPEYQIPGSSGIAFKNIRTVTAEGLVHAHNARIPLQRRRITPDLGTFAPQIMHMRIIAKICIFWPYISSKNFRNNIFRLNSTRAIDWCTVGSPFLSEYSNSVPYRTATDRLSF